MTTIIMWKRTQVDDLAEAPMVSSCVEEELVRTRR